MARPGMAQPGPPEFFLALKRLFGPTGPVFRAGWAVKILVRKNQANFGPARFWPGPVLARPTVGQARPARLPPLVGKETEFKVKEDRSLYYKGRVCVPNDCELKKAILDETHNGSFAIHPGSTKMYQDLKMSFWWSRMKRDV